MVNRCINPACQTEFRLLNSGDLYAVERPDSEAEFFWICSDCASKFNLYLDPTGVVSLRARANGENNHPPLLKASLRLVAHARRHMPWHYAVPAGSGKNPVSPKAWSAHAVESHF